MRRWSFRDVGAVPVWVLAVVVLVLTVLVLGNHTPVRRAGTTGVALGPEGGQQVSAYLVRAVAELPTAGGPYWALVSLRSELEPAAAAAVPGDARVAQAILRVPIERVQTAQLPVDVADQGELTRELTAAQALAGSRLQQLADSETGRAAAVARVSAARLHAGCACVLALLVRGTAEQLRAIAGRPEVRGVQAAAADVPPQYVALRALLPEQTAVVSPLPDDGAVPAP